MCLGPSLHPAAVASMGLAMVSGGMSMVAGVQAHAIGGGGSPLVVEFVAVVYCVHSCISKSGRGVCVAVEIVIVVVAAAVSCCVNCGRNCVGLVVVGLLHAWRLNPCTCIVEFLRSTSEVHGFVLRLTGGRGFGTAGGS